MWNERTGNIVGGHMRFKVLKERGRLPKGNADSTVKAADLMKEAVQVETLEDAIELARRQAQQ